MAAFATRGEGEQADPFDHDHRALRPLFDELRARGLEIHVILAVGYPTRVFTFFSLFFSSLFLPSPCPGPLENVKNCEVHKAWCSEQWQQVMAARTLGACAVLMALFTRGIHRVVRKGPGCAPERRIS